jgi:hypothetical protein
MIRRDIAWRNRNTGDRRLGKSSRGQTLPDAALEVDARAGVVLVRAGGVTPAGQRRRDQRANIHAQPPPSPRPAIPKRPLGGPGDRGV